jgi:sugar O-acyltransferase (sialic acid O-acetyltransferase NeuD family)
MEYDEARRRRVYDSPSPAGAAYSLTTDPRRCVIAALRPLVIVGAGGHAREVLDVVEAINANEPTYDVRGFVDDGGGDRALLGRRGVPLIGPVAELASLEADYVIGLGSPQSRRAVDAEVSAFGRSPVTLIHPTATVGSDLRLGPGLVAAAGARITTNVTTGRHVHLNLNATVSHDCVLDDYVTLSPGASVSGNVHLGAEVVLGVGAVVIQSITVGARTVVGAGAAVVRDLPDDVTAVGVPAQPLPAR